MHALMAGTLDRIDRAKSETFNRRARTSRSTRRPRWPMIVLVTPERMDRTSNRRWPCCRRHVSRASGAAHRSRAKPEHLELLEAWLKSYRPEELFDARGAFRPELAALAPVGDRRMGANPHANGGLLLQRSAHA